MKTLIKTTIAVAIIMQSFNLNAKTYTIIDFFDYGAFEINISLKLKVSNYNKVCNKIGYNWYDNYIIEVVHASYDSLDLYNVSEEKLISGLTDLIVSESKALGFKINDYDMVLAIDSKSEVEFFEKDERKGNIIFAATITTLTGIIILITSTMSSK